MSNYIAKVSGGRSSSSSGRSSTSSSSKSSTSNTKTTTKSTESNDSSNTKNISTTTNITPAKPTVIIQKEEKNDNSLLYGIGGFSMGYFMGNSNSNTSNNSAESSSGSIIENNNIQEEGFQDLNFWLWTIPVLFILGFLFFCNR